MTLAAAQIWRRPAAATQVLVRRSLVERRRLIGGIGLALLMLATMIAALYSSVGQAYDEVLEEMPAALDAMLGGADFGTPAGFIQVELFSLVAPGLVIAAAVSIAAGCLAGAEQSGRLSLVAVSPIRRSRLVTAAIGATGGAVIAVVLALGIGILLGAEVGGLDLDASRVVEACLGVALLGVAVGMITLAAGTFLRSRGTATGIAVAVTVSSYAITSFFPLSETLEPFAKFTLWYPYSQNQPLLNGLDLSHVAALTAVSGLAAAIAYRGFERRDLHC